MAKFLVALLCAAALPFAAFPQTVDFDSFFKSYSKVKGVESMDAGWALISAGKLADKKNEIPKGLKSVKGIYIKKESAASPETIKNLNRDILKVAAAMTLISTRKEGDGIVSVYYVKKTKENKYEDLLMYSSHGNFFSAMLMKGEFTEEDKIITEFKK